MADHTSTVTYQVEARDEFRASPVRDYNNDSNPNPHAMERLSGWKLTYEDAQGNGMEMLALGVHAFTVEKRVVRVHPDTPSINGVKYAT